MFTVTYGGKGGSSIKLTESPNLLGVRTRSRNPISRAAEPSVASILSDQALSILCEFELEQEFSAAGVSILKTRAFRNSEAVRDMARAVLKQEPDVQFAGRVLVDPTSKAPVLYTENFFVKFDDEAKVAECKKLLKKYILTVICQVGYLRNAYFVRAPEGTGMAGAIRDIDYREDEMHRNIVMRAALVALLLGGGTASAADQSS